MTPPVVGHAAESWLIAFSVLRRKASLSATESDRNTLAAGLSDSDGCGLNSLGVRNFAETESSWIILGRF